MASIWKRKSERRDPTAKWRITYQGSNGARLTVTGCTDRRVTEEIARKLESDVALKQRGVIDGDSEKIIDAARKPILEHQTAFMSFVRSQKPSGHAPRYIQQIESRITAFLKFGEITFLPEVTSDKFAAHVASMQSRGCSGFTINEHIGTLKQFTQWAVMTNRLRTDPLVAAKKADASKLEKKRPRRALSAGEIGCLLSATLDRPLKELRTIRTGRNAGKTIGKVRPEIEAKAKALGQSRMLAYLLALWTGLRRSELAALCWGDVHFDTIPAKLVLRANTTKSKRADSIALHPQIADALRTARPKTTNPTQRVLPAVPNMKVLRADMVFAGIVEQTESGRVDLHAMRKSLGTFLAAHGVPQRVSQAHLRHSDPRLTAVTYTDEALLPTAAAIANLPPLPTAPPQKLRATGTCDYVAHPGDQLDGADVHQRAAPAQRAARTSTQAVALSSTQGVEGVNSGESAQVHEKTGACAPVHRDSEKRAKGLEPSTFTLAT